MPSKKTKKTDTNEDVREEKPVPKKRGRRPKDKTYAVISNYKEVSDVVEDENVILHLPTDDGKKEEEDSINTNGMMKYDPNLLEPAPYEPMNNMQSDYAIISDKLQEKFGNMDEENVELGGEGSAKDMVNMEMDEVCVRKVGFEEINKNYFNVLKKAKILKLVNSEDGDKEWDMKTTTACFYCTECFDSVPVGIPMKYVRGKFYCRDTFCSFNCAAAYIFSGYDMRYHFKKWEYYSLLCMLASMVEGEEKSLKKVKLAENRNLLKKFGGPLTIEKFREQFNVLDSKYSMLYPPLACMYPQAELAHYTNMHRQKAQMLNSESRFSFGDVDLRLKREKPLTQKKFTLEEYMSLKIN